MQELDSARFHLVCAMPTPSRWQGPAASAQEQAVWELIHELNAVRDALWA